MRKACDCSLVPETVSITARRHCSQCRPLEWPWTA